PPRAHASIEGIAPRFKRLRVVVAIASLTINSLCFWKHISVGKGRCIAEADLSSSPATGFGGDHQRSVDSLRSVQGCCIGSLQHRDAFNIIGVEATDVGYGDTVDYIQGCIGISSVDTSGTLKRTGAPQGNLHRGINLAVVHID